MTISAVSSAGTLQRPAAVTPPPPKPEAAKTPPAGNESRTPPLPVKPEGVGGHLDLLA